MNFNNILEVPTQDQIEGFYGEEVLRGSFQSVEGSGGGRIECKCCKSQLSSLAKRPDLKKHLLTHALLVKDERIKHFERSQTEPDKLVCTFCRGEYKFQHAFRHLQSCKKKNGTGSAGRKNVRRVFGERNFHGSEDGSLLNKRTHEEHAEAYCGEDKVEPDDEAEEEEKLEKKVKTEKVEKAVFSSLNGREGSSFAKKMYDFMVANKGLEKRALQLKIKEFVEPLQEQWEEERKIWESEIEKVRAEQRLDNQEKNKKIEELQRQIEKIEDEKKELEKAIKESEIAIKKEMESEIDQRIETNNAVMHSEIRRQVEECLKNMGLQAAGYGYDYDDAM